MRETEILRGLAKAKQMIGNRKYATGMVPTMTEKPTFLGAVRDRIGELVSDITPKSLVTNNSGGTGNAARMLEDQQPSIESTLKDAGAYARGVVNVDGPGTTTSDSIPARISRKEAVLPAKTVQAVGPQNLARLIEATNGAPPKVGTGLRAAKFATGYVDDPVARANQARMQDPTPKPSVEPVRTVNPTLDMPELNPTPAPAEPAPSGLRGRIDAGWNKTTDAAKTAWNKVSGGTTAGEATAGEAATSNVAGFAKGAARLDAAAAPVIGAVQAVADSPEHVKALADSTGMDYDSFGGRVGSNVLNFLSKTGAAASFGLAGAAGRGIARALNGESFFEPYAGSTPATSKPAPPAPPAPAPAPPAPAPVESGTIGANPVAGSTITDAPNAARDIRSGRINVGNISPGTGFVTTNGGRSVTGGVSGPSGVMIDARGSQGSQGPQSTQPATVDNTGSALEQANAPAAAGDNIGQTWANLATRARNINVARSQQQSDDTRYVSDNSLRAQQYARQLGYAGLQRDLNNDNEKRVNDQLNTLSQSADNTGKVTIDPVKRADLERKVIGTYGKYGLTKGQIPQDELNEFLNLNQAGGNDPGLLQKLDDFVAQRHRVTSNDVEGNRAVGTNPGVFVDSTVDANGNQTPTYIRHGATMFGNNANADIRKLDNQTIQQNQRGLRQAVR